MNNVALAQTAYGTPQAPVRCARSIEYQAFAKITSELLRLKDQPENFVERISAIHENRRLWDILSIDVLADGNGLPDELRAGIYNISQFVVRHTAMILRDEGKIDPLIDINKTVMRGLRSTSGEV